MMKLLTNDSNLNALKIITASEHCKQSVEVQLVEVTEEKALSLTKLPILVADGFEYFSPNAACRYLFLKSGKQIDINTDSWLEWESTVLQPYVINCISSTKGPVISGELQCFLNYIDAVFGKQEYLSNSELYGLADICVWTSIYPLFKVYSISEVTTFANIKRWFNKLNELEPFQKAVSKVFGNSKEGKLKVFYSPLPLPVGDQKTFMPIVLPDFNLSCVSQAMGTPKDSEDGKEYVFTQEEIETAYQSWLKGISALPTFKHTEAIKLPKKGEKNILITSALPYVNNVPHLGNIIGAVLSADAFARYCRLRNYNTLYICGTDEYGTATETKAIEMGVTPKEICDKFNKLHADIYQWFNISFDLFGRTTTNEQTVIAQDIFNRLHNKNLLIENTVEQLYCEKCQRFLADRFVEGICPFCAYEEARGDQCDKCAKLINAPELKKPACKVCKSTPHVKTSKHLFLDLPKLEPALKEYVDKAAKSGHWSNTAKVVTLSWLKEGLKPRCITRDLKWGTPVPLEGYKDKVFYVWYDAPIGYLSITANYTKEWERWWKQPDLVELYQFMAKDNVPFHSIIFPSCQLGADDNYTIVNHLCATEYLNYEEMKFSKSRGVGIFGDDVKDTGIPADIWRFYLLYMRPENQDSFFSWSDLLLKNNSELLNNLGNFINRALMFISNNFDGIIPEMKVTDDEKQLFAQITHELKSYINCMEKTRLRDAIRPMLTISRIGNQYVQAHKPWELIKSEPEDRAAAGTIVGVSANIACLLCTLMEPYMPQICSELRKQLNTSTKFHVLIPEFVCLLAPGHKLAKPKPLFQKIDQELINQLKIKYAGRQTTPEKVDQVTKKDAAGDCPQVNGPSADAGQIDKLNALVTEQGNKVRDLKGSKAEKSVIDQEVSVLLELKKQLAILKGEDPVPAKGKNKGKSKKQ